ncbi:MAG TPA: GNAT family N-acetyltransferase [Mycobacteriales bacterium]|nr:GNAT family N-acetyltransferase [Mycobacteriales bacterium]
MHPLLSRWDRVELSARADDVLEVYAAAMDVPVAAARTRKGIILSHLDRRDLRAVGALEGDRLVGIAYGYLGEPGQWWHDQVAASLSRAQVATWLTGAFEVCELHVVPALQGHGVGRDLLDNLLTGTGTRTAILTTPDQETRARRFYRAGGWEDLVLGLRFPGDPRSFAVLGKELA